MGSILDMHVSYLQLMAVIFQFLPDEFKEKVCRRCLQTISKLSKCNTPYHGSVYLSNFLQIFEFMMLLGFSHPDTEIVSQVTFYFTCCEGAKKAKIQPRIVQPLIVLSDLVVCYQ